MGPSTKGRCDRHRSGHTESSEPLFGSVGAVSHGCLPVPLPAISLSHPLPDPALYEGKSRDDRVEFRGVGAVEFLPTPLRESCPPSFN